MTNGKPLNKMLSYGLLCMDWTLNKYTLHMSQTPKSKLLKQSVKNEIACLTFFSYVFFYALFSLMCQPVLQLKKL